MQPAGFEPEEVQFWLYDLMTGQLDYEHAIQFFHFVGGIIPDTLGTEVANPATTDHMSVPCEAYVQHQVPCASLPSSPTGIACRRLPSVLGEPGKSIP